MQGNLGLTPVQAPCKGCADRHTGCHTDCTRYIAFRREADRYKQEQSKDAARCEPRKARREATLLMSGITEQEYAAWLEKALQALYKSKPLAIAIVAKTEAGNTLTGYYNADAQDKAVFAHHIQSDIVLDIIKANAAEIKAMMEGVDDGTD